MAQAEVNTLGLSAFLEPIFTAYMTKHQPLEGQAGIKAEIQALQTKIAELESRLCQSVTEDEIKKFLISAEALMGGHASEIMLTNMLVAKFGGAAEEPPRRGRGRGKKKDKGALLESSENANDDEVDAPKDDVTEEEKDLILQVLTRESMSISEVAEATSVHTGDEWLASDISPILRALIKDNKVTTEGERRGKRYMLPAA